MALTGFNQGVAQQLGSPQYLNQIAGLLGGEAAPGIAAYGLQGAQAEAQAGVAPAALGVGIAEQTQGAGYDLANALLNYQGTQLQEQGLAGQIGTAAQQQAIEQQQYGGQLAQLGVTQQGTALQQANLAYQTPQQYQKQAGAAAAAGALNTQGNKQAVGNIQQQAAYQGSQLGLQAQSEFIQQQLAGLGQQSEQVGYGGQQQQMANQQQQLQLAAKQAGIPVQQAYSQLQYGIGQLGIQADPTQLIGQAATGQAGEAAGYGAVGAQLGATTGMGAQNGYNLMSGNPINVGSGSQAQ
jgi:hypothetical protein